MTLQGKGYFTFILTSCEGGVPAAVVTAAQAAGLSHVLVKIADGVKAFGVNDSGYDFTAPVVQALRAAGIAVWGWHYVYGNNPSGEAKIAIQRMQSLDLDGYVVDAEAEYKQSGKKAAASQFMSAVRGALTVPIALSSFRFPNYHPELPWSTFLEKCDYHMPQVYWEQAHNAGAQLRESKRQCDALPNAKPYIATGPTYGVTGWVPTQADISEFLSAVRSLGITAVNFFDWEYCRQNLPGLWTTIANFKWVVPSQVGEGAGSTTSSPEPSTEPSSGGESTGETTPSGTGSGETTDVFTTQFMTALNSRKAGQVAALYASTAVCVLADKILQGSLSIKAGYATFFSSLSSGTTFTLSKVEVDDDVRYIMWEAGTLTGQTTLILLDNKIIWEYTFLN